jgi:DNA transposition AAA+ family ATPase
MTDFENDDRFEIPVLDPETPKEKLKARVKEIAAFIDGRGMSQNQFAIQCSLSSSVVSQVLSDTYKGDVEKVVTAMLDVVERERTKDRISLKRPDFQTTSVFKNFMYLLEIAQSDKMIKVIIGDAGLGKSESLAYYEREHKATTLLVKVNPTFKDSTILRKIADKLGMQSSGSKDVLFDNIVTKLTGTGKMIIVDEADYLNVKALDVLRRIFDEADVPLVLVGLEKLRKMISSVSDRYRQVFSRMDCVQIPPLNLDDTSMLVKSVFDANDSIINHFHKASGANARKLVNLMIRTQRLMALNNRGLEIKVIDHANAGLL